MKGKKKGLMKERDRKQRERIGAMFVLCSLGEMWKVEEVENGDGNMGNRAR